MKIQSLLTMALCITTTTNFPVGGLLSLFDTSSTVTTPDAPTITQRIKETELLFSQPILEQTNFAQFFGGKRVTTSQLIQLMDSFYYDIVWAQYLKNHVPAQHRDKAFAQLKEKDKPQTELALYELLLKDHPAALQEIRKKLPATTIQN